MARELKKSIPVNIKITEQLDTRIKLLQEEKTKQTDVKLTRTQIIEMILEKGLEQYGV